MSPTTQRGPFAPVPEGIAPPVRSALQRMERSNQADKDELYQRSLDQDGVVDTHESRLDAHDAVTHYAYTEAFGSTFVNVNNVAWETITVTGLPASAVAEIVIRNSDGLNARVAGVRTVGSSLNRYEDVEEDGYLVMHVKANASSQIQTYSEDKADITFRLLGYWS